MKSKAELINLLITYIEYTVHCVATKKILSHIKVSLIPIFLLGTVAKLSIIRQQLNSSFER